MRAVIALAIAVGAVLSLGGCISTAGIVSGAQPIAPERIGLDANAETAPGVAADWWRSLGDPALNDIVDRALAGNPSLKVAQARLARAQAGVAVSQSANGVHLNGTLDATRQRLSGNSTAPAPLGGSVVTQAAAQIGASYEIDFFGRNRAAIAAAVGTQRAAQADLQAARILLASTTARTYVQLGRLFAQRQVAARSLGQREEILSLTRSRVSAGLDSKVELRQSETAAPESRQQIEQIDGEIALARHALAALTAQAPNTYDHLAVTLHAVQATPVPNLLPADLLGRRADISAARWRIEAATHEVQSAKAGFYPNINLSAFAGLASVGLDRLIRADSRQYGGGPALTLPIFDAGRLRGNLRARTADLDAAIESYNGAVIDAAHDAADQISSARSIERQRAEQARAQAAAESAYDLALQRYRAGLGTYLTVLTVETSVLNQRRLGADLLARSLDVQIALMHALGGGYASDSLGRAIENRLTALTPEKSHERP